MTLGDRAPLLPRHVEDANDARARANERAGGRTPSSRRARDVLATTTTEAYEAIEALRRRTGDAFTSVDDDGCARRARRVRGTAACALGALAIAGVASGSAKREGGIALRRERMAALGGGVQFGGALSSGGIADVLRSNVVDVNKLDYGSLAEFEFHPVSPDSVGGKAREWQEKYKDVTSPELPTGLRKVPVKTTVEAPVKTIKGEGDASELVNALAWTSGDKVNKVSWNDDDDDDDEGATLGKRTHSSRDSDMDSGFSLDELMLKSGQKGWAADDDDDDFPTRSTSRSSRSSLKDDEDDDEKVSKHSILNGHPFEEISLHGTTGSRSSGRAGAYPSDSRSGADTDDEYPNYPSHSTHTSSYPSHSTSTRSTSYPSHSSSYPSHSSSYPSHSTSTHSSSYPSHSTSTHSTSYPSHARASTSPSHEHELPQKRTSHKWYKDSDLLDLGEYDPETIDDFKFGEGLELPDGDAIEKVDIDTDRDDISRTKIADTTDSWSSNNGDDDDSSYPSRKDTSRASQGVEKKHLASLMDDLKIDVDLATSNRKVVSLHSNEKTKTVESLAKDLDKEAEEDLKSLRKSSMRDDDDDDDRKKSSSRDDEEDDIRRKSSSRNDDDDDIGRKSSSRDDDNANVGKKSSSRNDDDDDIGRKSSSRDEADSLDWSDDSSASTVTKVDKMSKEVAAKYLSKVKGHNSETHEEIRRTNPRLGAVEEEEEYDDASELQKTLGDHSQRRATAAALVEAATLANDDISSQSHSASLGGVHRWFSQRFKPATDEEIQKGGAWRKVFAKVFRGQSSYDKARNEIFQEGSEVKAPSL